MPESKSTEITKPTPPEILYHYCSTSTFYSIISTNNIWLSALASSNDALEGRWIRKITKDLCEREKYESYISDEILDSFEIIHHISNTLGCCFSEEGDLLSQWRGYADDGCGICIGFSTKYFLDLSDKLLTNNKSSFSLNRVIYNPTTQEDLIRPTIEEMKSTLKDGSARLSPGLRFILESDEERNNREHKYNSARAKLALIIVSQMVNSFSFKNPAFIEEKEWRILSFTTKSDSENIMFHPRRSNLVPYRAVPLNFLSIPSIVSISTGPKNNTEESHIKILLNSFGFNDVNISKSNASYR